MMATYSKTPRLRTMQLSKGTIYHEPTPRWYRAWVSPTADVASTKPTLDSRDLSIVWEDGGSTPYAAFPKHAVPFDAARPAGGHFFRKSPTKREPKEYPRTGNLANVFYDLVSVEESGREVVVVPFAAWTWDAEETRDVSAPNAYPSGGMSESKSRLTSLVGVAESAFGTWYEEAQRQIPGAHVPDPYHRVDAVRSNRHVQVYATGDGGTLLAESKHPVIVFETELVNRYYLQRSDVIKPDEVLSKELTGLKTVCPYKGVAEYYDVTVGGEVLKNQVWTYRAPVEEAGKIKDLLAFYVPGPNFRLAVDGEEVKA